MTDLPIIKIKDELRTDSRLLASFLDHRHRTILENIDKYSAELLELSELPFQTELGEARPQGGRTAQRFALLNEDQCYFLLTLMRNNQKVVRAKLELVKAFKDARVQLARTDAARLEGKQIRRLETDSIKELVDYASAKGSKSAQMYYANITKMTNKILGIEAGNRDKLTADELKKVTIIESVVDIAIRDGLKAEMNYRDIYKLAKARAESVTDLVAIESKGE